VLPRCLALLVCLLPVEVAALSIDAASVRLNFKDADTFRLSGQARGLSLDGIDVVSVAVDRFEFSVSVDQLVHKGRMFTYRATGDDPALSLFRINSKTGRFVASGKHLALSGISNPFAVRLEAGTFAECSMVPMEERVTHGRRSRSKAARIERLTLRARAAGGACEFLAAPELAPGALLVGQPATVRVEVGVVAGASVDAGSMRLFRADAAAKPTGAPLCSLADDGGPADGDTVAGDGTFTCLAAFDESAPGRIPLVVTATVHGKTVVAPGAALDVVPPLGTQDAQTIVDVQTTAGHTWTTNLSTFGDTLRARMETIRTLRVLPGVADAGLTLDGLSIWIEYDSGVEGGLMLSPRLVYDDTAPSGSSVTIDQPAVRRSLSASAPASAPGQRPLVGNQKVLLWDTGAFDGGHLTEDPLTMTQTAPTDSEIGDVRKLFEQSACPVFAPDDIVTVHGSAATLDSLRGITDYGTVVLVTDGEIGNGQIYFVTGESTFPENLVGLATDLQLRSIGVTTTRKGTFFTVTPSFIRDVAGAFQNSIVDAAFCHSSQNVSMASAFIGKGAATYFGYTQVVTSAFAHQGSVKLFTGLLPGDATAVDTFAGIGPSFDYFYIWFRYSKYDPATFAKEFTDPFWTSRVAHLAQTSGAGLANVAYLGTPSLMPPQSTIGHVETVQLKAMLPGADGCTLTYHWTNTATAGHLTDGVPGHVDDFDSVSDTATYTSDCTNVGTDTIGVGISDKNKRSLGAATATVEVADLQGLGLRGDSIGVCTTSTTTTTLPPGGVEFFLGGSCCKNGVVPDACSMEASLGGQTCNGSAGFVCVCTSAGHVVPNNVFYAYPGDSFSIQCFTCNQQCIDWGVTVSNSIDLFPQTQTCLASAPPTDTWTPIVEASAPIPFPATYAPRFCCELPSSHCLGGGNDGGSCADDTSCSGGGHCSASCFEYAVGQPGEQNCVQLGGSPDPTYCGVYGTCGVF
jgi:hypothetical protein